MKPTIAVMLGEGKGKHGSDDEDYSSNGGDDDAAESAAHEEMGNAVAEALSAKDPKALYDAICAIVRYEKE